jgi:hypothetical protein
MFLLPPLFLAGLFGQGLAKDASQKLGVFADGSVRSDPAPASGNPTFPTRQVDQGVSPLLGVLQPLVPAAYLKSAGLSRHFLILVQRLGFSCLQRNSAKPAAQLSHLTQCQEP